MSWTSYSWSMLARARGNPGMLVALSYQDYRQPWRTIHTPLWSLRYSQPDQAEGVQWSVTPLSEGSHGQCGRQCQYICLWPNSTKYFLLVRKSGKACPASFVRYSSLQNPDLNRNPSQILGGCTESLRSPIAQVGQNIHTAEMGCF